MTAVRSAPKETRQEKESAGRGPQGTFPGGDWAEVSLVGRICLGTSRGRASEAGNRRYPRTPRGRREGGPGRELALTGEEEKRLQKPAGNASASGEVGREVRPHCNPGREERPQEGRPEGQIYNLKKRSHLLWAGRWMGHKSSYFSPPSLPRSPTHSGSLPLAPAGPPTMESFLR